MTLSRKLIDDPLVSPNEQDRFLGGFIGIIGMHAPTALADQFVVEDFSGNPLSRWEFIADGVMGGVSRGDIQFDRVDERIVMTLSGTGSTENNGGFIQARRTLSADKSRDYQGIIHQFNRSCERLKAWLLE